MLNEQQKYGKKNESFAAGHLSRLGYEILELNFRTKLGEIDIIAKDGDTIVFVEVKSRSSYNYGSPKQAVTAKKQKKISMVALYYLKTANQLNAKARFDVVSIMKKKDDEPEIEIIKNAFELSG